MVAVSPDYSSCKSILNDPSTTKRNARSLPHDICQQINHAQCRETDNTTTKQISKQQITPPLHNTPSSKLKIKTPPHKQNNHQKITFKIIDFFAPSSCPLNIIKPIIIKNQVKKKRKEKNHSVKRKVCQRICVDIKSEISM